MALLGLLAIAALIPIANAIGRRGSKEVARAKAPKRKKRK